MTLQRAKSATRVSSWVPAAVAALLCWAPCQAIGLGFSEPPDLTSNLASPDPLGPLSPGRNTVSGSIDDDCDADPSCGPDEADAFSFVVPEGHLVTNIALEITNYSSTQNARARVRNFSGGTETHFFEGDTVFPNLIDVPGGLGPGTYDLQIHAFHDDDPETHLDVGAVSLDWMFTFTVPEAGATSSSLAALLALAGLAARRRAARATTP